MNKSHKKRLINKYSACLRPEDREIITSLVEEISKWAGREIKYAKEHTDLMSPQCSMCRKEVDIEKNPNIYFDWSSNRIHFLCSDKHDRSYRIKNTCQLTGFVGFCFIIHKVVEVEKCRPIVLRERYLKEVKDHPWNNPVKLWKEVKERVAESGGEIVE